MPTLPGHHFPDRVWVDDLPFQSDGCSPEELQRIQRRDVRAALRTLGPGATVEAISELTCLPRFNVLRALDLWVDPVLVKRETAKRGC